MRIEQSHSLGKEEVKKRSDGLAESLVNMPIPGGVSVGDISRQWHDDTMDFAFRVSKGFFGADIKGQVNVTDTNVILDIKVPPIVSSFVDEDKIRSVIQTRMSELVK
ncbi:MAG TPA: polyhydroxyalkanoic acid system family protein [Bacteroidota bacterium]|nr:polyhydroxyalkanoic acid system family protein [Bacteroidota bacterium]